jgi:tetratricopeptide (TPR) repeat protein
VRLFAVAFVLILVGCSSSPAPEPPRVPAAEEMTSQHRVARFAFEARQYDQAVSLYEQALVTAHARDDAREIGELGYELAVVRLRRGEAKLAETQVRDTVADLERRGQKPFAELRLVQALALYAQDEREQARAVATSVVEAPGVDPATAARAWHLRGMIAADRGEGAELAAALAALPESASPALAADRLELAARRQVSAGAFDTARGGFERVAALRRDSGDYVGLARALAAAGKAAEASGDRAEAANLYIRAARSAAAEERRAEAREWFNTAARLATEGGRSDLAREASLGVENLK